MKTIREIITNLNVARSSDCSQEKSKEIKEIIYDLLPYAETLEKITDFYKKRELDSDKDLGAFYYDYYVVYDGWHIRVNERLYKILKKMCGRNEPDRLIEEV